MMKRVYNIIDTTTDKVLLKSLKVEVTAENADVDEVLNRYVSLYDEDTIDYGINLGYERTIMDLKGIYSKLKPCSNPMNYREMNIKARGEWKDIYEIAFGSPSVNIKTKKITKERNKQIKFKEAA